MKVFISIGMHGKTDEQISKVLEVARRKIKKEFECIGVDDVEIIDNFSAKAPDGYGRLWYLGEAIKKLDGCDYCYFVTGWSNYKGCRIEYEVCKEYGIKVMGSPK